MLTQLVLLKVLVELLQVWFKFTRLLIEHYLKSSVELMVSGFGRLHRCNMEKQNEFIGAFYAMIDCHDIDLFPSRIEFNNDDDSYQCMSTRSMHVLWMYTILMIT